MTSRQRFFVFGIAAACLMFSGCAHKNFQGKAAPQEKAMAKPEIPAFSYSKLDPEKIRLKTMGESDRWTEYQLKFAVKDFPEGKNKYAKAFYFAQKDQSKKAPCLILLPPTGGPIELIRDYAVWFADKGFSTMAFYRRERFFRPDKPLEFNVNLFRQAVIDVRRGVDFFHTRADADTSRIGIMGISLGGIITALSLESDPRIRAGATIVSAAYLPDILDTSGYKVVRKLRKGLMKNEGVPREKLKEFIAPVVHSIDPLTYADRIDPERFLMINGRSDNIIKFHIAEKTRKAYGNPEMIIMMGGHYPTIASRHYTSRRIYDFLVDKLDLQKDEKGRVVLR